MNDRPRPSLFHETLLLSHRDQDVLPEELRALLSGADAPKLEGLLRKLALYAAPPRLISRSNPYLLPLGVSEIDRILGGGAMQGHVLEVFGPSSSGKTQLAHCAAAMTAARPREGVIYVDSTGSFSVRRLGDVLARVQSRQEEDGHDGQDDWRSHLDKVEVVSTRDVASVVANITSILGRRNPAYDRVSMVVIDSIGSLLAPLIGGFASQVGHEMMLSFGTFLKQVARVHSCVVLVTNHTVSAYSNSSSNYSNYGGGDVKGGTVATFHAHGLEQAGFVLRRAALGEAWPGNVNIRIQLVMKSDTAGGGVPGVDATDENREDGVDNVGDGKGDEDDTGDETSQAQLSRSHRQASGATYNPVVLRAAVVVQSSVNFVAPVGTWAEIEF